MTITCPNGHTQHIVNVEDLRDEIRCPECGVTFNLHDSSAGYSATNED